MFLPVNPPTVWADSSTVSPCTFTSQPPFSPLSYSSCQQSSGSFLCCSKGRNINHMDDSAAPGLISKFESLKNPFAMAALHQGLFLLFIFRRSRNTNISFKDILSIKCTVLLIGWTKKDASLSEKRGDHFLDWTKQGFLNEQIQLCPAVRLMSLYIVHSLI